MGMMEGNGLSIADAMALARSNEDGFGMGGSGAWVFFLFFLLAWGGNGFWGNRGGADAIQGAVTRSDLFEGFNNQDVNAQLRGITNGLCDGFYAQNTAIMNGFHGVDTALCQGFTGVNANIANLGYQMKDCCCETNRNIDAVRYENSRNTCEIVNAIREDGNATRALINANTMQDLRDKIADKDRELMTANFQLSQQAQNAYLINEIKPCAIPAYLTCSPYESANLASRFYNCGGCGSYA